MKHYLIGLLAVLTIFLLSVIYKNQNEMVCRHFPVPESLKKKAGPPPLYLFLFFSKDDCLSCLVEMVDVLNALPPEFCVAGIASVEKPGDEQELRRLSGASFPIYRFQKFKKYLPWNTPTLFGVSPAGKIIFILPGIPGQGDYLDLRGSLLAIYGRLYPALEKERSP